MIHSHCKNSIRSRSSLYIGTHSLHTSYSFSNILEAFKASGKKSWKQTVIGRAYAPSQNYIYILLVATAVSHTTGNLSVQFSAELFTRKCIRE